MEHQTPTLVEVGTEAMLELEEMNQGLRANAPALKDFFEMIRTPTASPVFAGNSAVSMLADVRAYPVLRDVTGISRADSYRDFEQVVIKYLEDIEQGVEAGDGSCVRKAKNFCYNLVNSLVSRDMTEVLSRKKDPDGSHFANALI